MEFEAHFARKGIAITRLDLRVPSFEHLRLSTMIETVRGAIADESVVLIGSSLGGLTAARVAELDDRVMAVVLLAPAFQLVDCWRESLGPSRGTRGGLAAGARSTTTRPAASRESTSDSSKTSSASMSGYPKVEVPALVMHGVNDDVVPVGRSRTFAASRPNVRLVELPDGHELVASLPTLLAETESFLDDLSS